MMKNKMIGAICCAVSSVAPWSVGATTWIEKGGIVVMECEHQELTGDWVTRPTDYSDDPTMVGSSGSGWLEWTGAQYYANTVNESGADGVLTLNFEIEKEGVYNFIWRSKQYNQGAGDAGNDTYVQLKTGTPVSGFYDFSLFSKVWVQSKDNWSWATTFEPHHGDHYGDIKRYYTPGTHSIQLAGRSPGHAIDRIVLYHEDVAWSAATAAPESENDYQYVQSKFTFDADTDFPNINAGEVPYYIDGGRDVLAIDAANSSYRGKFARAEMTFTNTSAIYDVTISTMTEIDGESTYRLLINGEEKASFTNPRVDDAGDLQLHTHKWYGITVVHGDTVAVESNTDSNGLIPENGGFAWARGRWSKIELAPAGDPPPVSVAQYTPQAGLYGERTDEGDFKKWHRVTIAYEGPDSSETATPNPFLDYRLNVTFTHPATGKSYLVPGYYAADGYAGETSSESGNIWRVNFAPDEVGTWNYSTSFRSGSEVAISLDAGAGSPAGYFDGETGTFDVVASDKGGKDMRGKGRLVYDETRYLYHAETGERFIKTGADAPEGFLGYEGFDNTYENGKPYLKTWAPHKIDWNPEDGGWKETGEGILGAINYLSSKDMNVFSFLTYSAGGDTKTVWPFITYEGNRTRYDCSKLDQWEVVFSHGDKKGMYLHFKTQETENDRGTWGLDGGEVGVERKLYIRELIARFGHHIVLNWNMGEENKQTEAQQVAMANYWHDMDPYDHNLVLHTYPGEHYRYDYHIGGKSPLTGASLQLNSWSVHRETLDWINKSENSGRPWVCANDEQGNGNDAVPPDSQPNGINGRTQEEVRESVIWGNLMAGGAGVELYAGSEYEGAGDLDAESYRIRDNLWNYCRYAKHFFNAYLPFWDMENHNALVGNSSNSNDKFCFAKPGEIYAVFLPQGGSTTLNLSGVSGTFPVYWYNSREGGELQQGTVTSVSGGSSVSLGNAPSDTTSDWAVLVGQALYAGEDQAVMFAEETNSVSVALDGTVAMGAGTPVVTWSVLRAPTGGSVAFNNASAIDTSALITGATGVYELQLSATLGGTTLTDTVVIVAEEYASNTPGNSPPMFNGDVVQAKVAVAGKDFTDNLGRLAFDLNVEDTLTFTKVDGPTWLTIEADGSMSGLPGFAHLGTNEFNVTVQDDAGESDSAILQVVVENNPSVAAVLSPVADTYVSSGAADSNFGSVTELNVDADNMAYLRFEVGSVVGTATKAILRLNVVENGGAGAHSVRAVHDDNWGEAAVTWNNKPALGSNLADVSSVPAGEWLEVDVTDGVLNQINGDGMASLVISGADASLVKYASREAAAGMTPELIIQTNAPPVFSAGVIDGGTAREKVGYEGQLDATDVDAYDTLVYSLVDGPDWLKVAADGALSGVPNYWDEGTNVFVVMVTDSLESGFATLEIVVEKHVSLRPVGHTVEFTGSEGYANGALRDHGRWDSDGSAKVDVSGSGWGVLAPGYGNNAYSRPIPKLQDSFMVSMAFTFNETANTENKPLMNVGVYGSDNAGSAPKLKASLNRYKPAPEWGFDYERFYINLEGTDWFEQLGIASEAVPCTELGIDHTAGDTTADLLLLELTVKRGATADDWSMHSKLFNLTVDPAATNALIDHLAEGITHEALFAADNLYGGFGSGQSDVNAGVADRKIDTFRFVGNYTPRIDSEWDLYAKAAGLRGSPTADFDGDGLADIYEYAMGGNPTNEAIGPMKIRLDFEPSNHVSFYHPKRSGDESGVMYRAEWTTNLLAGPWMSEWNLEEDVPTGDPVMSEGRKRVWGEDKSNMFFRVYVEPQLLFDTSSTGFVANADLGVLIEAEQFDAQSGIQVSGGGSRVGYIDNGDWISFSGLEIIGATGFTANVSSGSSGGTVEIRSGSVSGPLLGSLNVGNTGGWNNTTEVSGVVSGVNAVADVYLVFTGGSGSLLDIDSFQFD